jgi:hypothetical protein
LEGNTSLEIVGLTYVPLKGGGQELNVNVIDKDGNNYMVAEKDVPSGIKTTNKPYMATKKVVVDSYNRANSKPQTVPKTVTDKFKGVPKGGF